MKEQIDGRELTKDETARLENLERISGELESEGYVRTELTMSLVEANKRAFVLAGIPAAILVAVFAAVNIDRIDIEPLDLFMSFVAMIVLIVVHEGIHGLVWGLLSPAGFKSIRFGFIKEFLTPYCTCTAPLNKSAYLAGGLAPGIVLGLLPCIVAIATGSLPLMLVGAVMLLGAGGDFAIAKDLASYKSEAAQTLCVDHPSNVGLVLFERAQ